MYVSPEKALQYTEATPPTTADMTVVQTFTIFSNLPLRTKALFLKNTQNVLRHLFHMTKGVADDAASNPAVTLATQHDYLSSQLSKRSQALFGELVQEDVISDVQQILDTRDLYSAEEMAESEKQGVIPWSSGAVALEYSKVLCRILELVPCSGAAGKIRNNCMRLCGISPFAVQAQLQVDPFLFCRMQGVTCSFCNSYIYVDLLEKRKSASSSFICPECHAPIAAASMEARLVRRVYQLLAKYSQQDFICAKCSEMAVTFLSQGCCGPLVGKSKEIEGELKALRHLAVGQDFHWLTSCLDAAMMCT